MSVIDENEVVTFLYSASNLEHNNAVALKKIFRL